MKYFWLVVFIQLLIVFGQEAAEDGSKATEQKKTAWDWVLELSIITVLVMLSGLFSGLTLGLMSLDKIGLEIVIGAGEAENATMKEKMQAYCARKIAPIRENGNLLLTTLLLGNVAVNAALSIVMSNLTNGLIGFLVSTAVIVVFGEIVPQAFCSRYALLIGSKVIPIVKVIIFLLYILAKPISWALDKVLGEEIGTIHSKRELLKMLDIHVKQKALDVEEGHIMSGAMSYREKRVDSIMTNIEEVFMLPVTTKLNFKVIRKIFESGYSRIPVWGKDTSDIVGLLFVKDLIFIDPEDETPVLNFIHIFGRGIHKIWPDAKLGEVLKIFKSGRGHLALVHDVNNTGEGDPYYEIKGLVTLEDIIEEILQDDIVDETDVFIDTGKQSKVTRRSFDYGRLRLLDARLVDETLSKDEVRAVSAHLLANHPQFKQRTVDGKVVSDLEFQKLIGKCLVIEYDPNVFTAKKELYTRNAVATHCTVILQGKVSIAAGREGFESEVGAWHVLAADSLITPECSYVPDFTATIVGTEKVRCLHISRVDYQQILYPLSTATKCLDSEIVTVENHSVSANQGEVLRSSTVLPSTITVEPKQF